MTGRTYLDWNATAPPRPQVVDAVAQAMVSHGNPSSVHGDGRRARAVIEDAREAVAALVGADPANVIFTSGGTEANNQAVSGRPAHSVIVSGFEHASVLEAAPEAITIAGQPDGEIDLDRLAEALKQSSPDRLVVVMLANNETGVIQPVEKVAALARAAGALFHCDAIQAAGRMAVDIAGIGASSISLSAHKLGGPMGVGALIFDGSAPRPLLKGGGQERGRRAGTENVTGIVGFGVAARLAANWRDEMVAVEALRDDMESRLAAAAPEAVFYGKDASRIANTSLIGLPGVDADTQLMALDLAGISVSAGSACSSGKIAPSHVLAAMGVDAVAANCAIRISIGPDTGADDIDRFITAWTQLRTDVRARVAA